MCLFVGEYLRVVCRVGTGSCLTKLDPNINGFVHVSCALRQDHDHVLLALELDSKGPPSNMEHGGLAPRTRWIPLIKTCFCTFDPNGTNCGIL